MEQTWQIVVSALGVGLPFLAALIVAVVRIERRFGLLERQFDQRIGDVERRFDQRIGDVERRLEGLDSRLDGLAAGVQSFNQQMTSLVNLISSGLGFLHRGQIITAEEYHKEMRNFVGLISQSTGPYVDLITTRANPITPEQAHRFRELVAMARRREVFTFEEAEEYNEILEIIREERPDDPGMWPLVALGAFFLGIYLGSRSGGES